MHACGQQRFTSVLQTIPDKILLSTSIAVYKTDGSFEHAVCSVYCWGLVSNACEMASPIRPQDTARIVCYQLCPSDPHGWWWLQQCGTDSTTSQICVLYAGPLFYVRTITYSHFLPSQLIKPNRTSEKKNKLINNVLEDMTCVCEMKDNISSTFFKYDE